MHASPFPVRGRPLPAKCMLQCRQSVMRSDRHHSPQQPRQHSCRSRDAVSAVSHSTDAADRFVVTTPLYYVNAGEVLTLLISGRLKAVCRWARAGAGIRLSEHQSSYSGPG